MSKVTIELEQNDARIVAGCIGVALDSISDPQQLFESILNPRRRTLIISLLGIMAGLKTRSAMEDAIQSPDGLDQITSDMAIKARQLTKLMRLIMHQTDPDKVPFPV